MKARDYTFRATLAELRRRIEGDSMSRHRDVDSLIRAVRDDERAKTIAALEGARDRADRETVDAR